MPLLIVGFLFSVNLTLLLGGQFVYYLFSIPQPFGHSPARSKLHSRAGTIAYLTAHVLAVYRLPFAFIPYLAKLGVCLLLRRRFLPYWNSYAFQAVRLAGDFLNLGITTAGVSILLNALGSENLAALFTVSVGAEYIRLLSEKGQMVFSGFWQLIPHRQIAQTIIQRQASSKHWEQLAGWLVDYCQYYALDDSERITYIVSVLHHIGTTAVAERMAYLRTLRIVPAHVNLRAGHVRDVARGEVFIHRRWTNDPWLLVGQALRRTPWIFDPRYLRRPFYYRTEANCLVTLFVLQNACYSPPYGWYQFGHEIKAARYDLFYSLSRWLGMNVERLVTADGIAEFDRLIRQLGVAPHDDVTQTVARALWADEEVVIDVTARLAQGRSISGLAIATRYTYPLKYVEEVLLPKILACQVNPVELPAQAADVHFRDERPHSTRAFTNRKRPVF